MGTYTRERKKHYRKNGKAIDDALFHGILNQAKEYANLAYLVGLLGDIPAYLERMEQIRKCNAYVRQLLEYHPDPLLAMSGRFFRDPHRDGAQDFDRGGGGSGRDRDAGCGGSGTETKYCFGLFHFAA